MAEPVRLHVPAGNRCVPWGIRVTGIDGVRPEELGERWSGTATGRMAKQVPAATRARRSPPTGVRLRLGP
jgi:hypothetical protein